MRKFTALMLSMIMVLALIPAASFAEGEKSFTEQAASTLDTVKRVFKSDENFSTAVGDGTWDNGVWRAELRDEWWNISTATSVYDNKAYISPSGDGWAHEWYPKVSGDIMYPLLQGGESDLKRRAVRTFIAPYSGKIEIKETIIENHANGCQVKYYINKDSQELWTVQSNGGNVTQNTIELDVQQGDLIRFEVEWVNLDGSNEIKWVNTIEYLPEATPTPSPSPTPTATPTPTSTPTPDPASTPTPTPDPALTPTATPTATPTPTPVPTVDPNRNEFSSNENFSTATADGNWDGGIWSAMCYVQDWWIYSDLTNVADGKYNLEWLENGHARVDGNTLETDTTIKNFTVRAFTSPQEGILRIEKATITNASAAAAKVQIRHKANNGDLKHIWKTGATEIAGNETTEQEQIELQVNEGDIIYFEAASASEGTGVIVEWINKLTYIDEFTPEPTPTPTPIPTPEPTPDLNKTVYRASDSWSMEKNGDDVWKWQSYKVALKTYEDLPNKMEGNLMMGDDWSDGPVWLAGEDWRWAAVGKYTMRATVDPGDPTTEETSGDFKVHRDYPVRTFTSPKNGTVSIQVPDNKIWAKDEITGTHIRIMCQRADGSKPIQIFPNAEETDWLNIKGEYNFEPIEFELNAGDKLMFENAFIWKEGGYSPWNTYVQWDPIVEYKTISPKLTGVIPADGAENIALNAEHILNYDGALADISADKLTVYEVNSEGENIKSDAVCSSIAVDGSSVKFVLDGLKPYTKYEAKLDGICYFGFDAKNEKSETITFTTGPAVNIGEAKYESGKVSVPVNNPYKENKTATLIAAVCKGTESKYSIEKTYYVTRRDIGANDVIETEAEFPSDSDYFIKIVVMEDMQKARAYAPSSIIRR